MVLDIIKYGEKDSNKLRLKNIDVIKENISLNKLISDMFETLDHGGGIGLAAPQVGHNLNMFIVKTPNFTEVFINPEIKLEGMLVQTKEGCLSFPNLEFPVDRYNKLQIRYFDRNWTLRLTEHKDMMAIILQHEYDHLKGKLIID